MTNPDPKPDTVDVTVKLKRPPEDMEWQIREPVPQREYYAGKMVTIEAVLRPIVPATVMVEMRGELAERVRATKLTTLPSDDELELRGAIMMGLSKAHDAALARKPEVLCQFCRYPEAAHPSGDRAPSDLNVCHEYTPDRKPCPVMVHLPISGSRFAVCINEYDKTRRPCKLAEGHGGEHE